MTLIKVRKMLKQKKNAAAEKREKEKLKKERINRFIGLIPSIITVLGIIIGIWQFNIEYRKRGIEEFRRYIWKKQLEVYENVGNATANVVNSTADSLEFSKAVDEYKHLYWGVMPMLQDDNVEKAMIKFNSEIRFFLRNESSTDDLRKKGYKLMKSCKVSLNNSWKKLTKDD